MQTKVLANEIAPGAVFVRTVDETCRTLHKASEHPFRSVRKKKIHVLKKKYLAPVKNLRTGCNKKKNLVMHLVLKMKTDHGIADKLNLSYLDDLVKIDRYAQNKSGDLKYIPINLHDFIFVSIIQQPEKKEIKMFCVVFHWWKLCCPELGAWIQVVYKS